MEVNGGKYLSKLFGTHFLMSMSIPILKESLKIESNFKYFT